MGRRGNERGSDRTAEDDEWVVKPDLVLFVNGIPLVVMEAKSPSLLEVWKAKAVRQLLRYQEAGPEWHGTGAPELVDTNLMCVALCGADAAYAAIGAPENACAQWKSIEPFAAPSMLAARFGARFTARGFYRFAITPPVGFAPRSSATASPAGRLAAVSR